MKIGFLGTGNMGGALARAAACCADNELYLANRHPEKAQKLAAELHCGAMVTDNESVVRGCECIFLGVKPQMFADLCGQIREALADNPQALLVSMIAGTAMQDILAGLGCGNPIIRIMPNTPAAVGAGMILYACSDAVTEAQEAAFLHAMAGAGTFSKLDERLIDAGSAVSGCGPAFAAMFIEALADGGVACGLPRAKAMEFAANMVAGTAKLITVTGKHPGVVKDEVCSPGGSTIQGVRTLEESAFRAAVTDAVIAAYEKTLEL